MSRRSILLFGVLTYALFLFTFLYQMGFVGGFVVPKTIDDGVVTSTLSAVSINVLLLGLFAVQHTIMARIAFKRWWTTIIPTSAERSFFVFVTSLLLLLINWQWRPMPAMVWHVDGALARNLIYAVSFAGWGIVLYSSFLINHFDLFGLRQVWLNYQGIQYTKVKFKEHILYQWVRHPLMLGFIIAFWASPDMTQGHLLFATVVSAYALIGIQIEERTLVALHGNDYLQYKQRVSMIIPMPPRPTKVEYPSGNESHVYSKPSPPSPSA